MSAEDPAAKTIHLVMDNLNIHSQKSLVEVFGAAMAAEVWDRFTVPYTPMAVGSIKRRFKSGSSRANPNESLRREASA